MNTSAPAKTRSRRRLFMRLLPASGIAGMLATLVLPIFTMTASAAPTAVNLPPRGVRADLGSIGRQDQIPFRTCVASFGGLTRDAAMLTTNYSNNFNTFLSRSDEINDRNANVTYVGTYVGPQYQGGAVSNSLSQGQFNFVLNDRVMGQDQVPVIQFADALSNAQPINGPFSSEGSCNGLVAIPVSTGEWRMYQISRTNGSADSPYWWGTLRNPRVNGNETTFSFEFYGVMPNSGNTVLERRTADFTVAGVANWNGSGGGGGGPTPGPAMNIEWVNASELKVTSGAYQGEVYRMGRWQSHNGHSYYFLHSGATGDRGGLTDANGRMCENDPGPMPLGNNCAGGTTNCVPFIEVRKAINFSRTAPQNFQPWLNSLGSGPAQLFDYNSPTECRSHQFFDVVLSNPGNNSVVWFYYSKAADGFQIVFTSGDGNEAPYIATYSKDPSGLYQGGTAGCNGRIQLMDPNAINLERFYVNWSLTDGNCTSISIFTTVQVQVIGGAAGDTKFQELAGIVADTGDDIGDGSRAADLVCDFSFNPLTWIMCPIIAGAQAGVEQLDNGINSLLAINVDRYFDENCREATCSGPGFYKAWNGVRILATAVIVIAALVMIVSQAAGWELLDAHTFRKMLPRMVIAVIAIPVSWELAKEAVRFSEVIGLGLRDIIYSPFGGQGALHVGAGTSTALALVGGAALLTLGIFAMLSFVVTAFLAALVAFAVLIFRQAAIIFLVILAPFAIACYIMPSTQKAWKFWSGSFMAMLLMFPIIVGMIAMGRVFAFVSHKADENNLFFQLVALVAYFLPYFMITTAFKLAGGAISAVSGFLGNATGGLANGLRQFRSNAARTNIGKMRSGDRFRGSNAVSRAFNSTTQGVGFGWEGRFGLGRRGAAMRDTRARQAASRAAKSEELQEAQFDDDGILALYLSAGESGRRAERELRALNPTWSDERVGRAVAMAQTLGINKSNAIAAGNLAADNKFRSLGDAANADVASRAISATNARLAGGRLVNDASQASGFRFEGGNSQMYNNLEGGVRWHARTHGATRFADTTLQGSWQRNSMGENNASTGVDKAAFFEDINTRLQTGVTSGNAGQAERAAVHALEMHTLLAHGPDAASQEAITAGEAAIGYDNVLTQAELNAINTAAGTQVLTPGNNYTWRQVRSFEEYLAQNWLGQDAGYGAALRNRARTYDGQDQEAQARMSRGA